VAYAGQATPAPPTSRQVGRPAAPAPDPGPPAALSRHRGAAWGSGGRAGGRAAGRYAVYMQHVQSLSLSLSLFAYTR